MSQLGGASSGSDDSPSVSPSMIDNMPRLKLIVSQPASEEESISESD